MKKDTVVILGDQSLGGLYLLLIDISKEIIVKFGKFKNGKEFKLEVGTCLYLGSARGKTLAARLLRHSSRTNDKLPHSIKVELINTFISTKMISKDSGARPKKLHWHIDYLLDNEYVSISKAILFRTQKSLEKQMGQFLLARPETKIIAPGLGASDLPGNSHLLQVSETKWMFENNYRIFENMLNRNYLIK